MGRLTFQRALSFCAAQCVDSRSSHDEIWLAQAEANPASDSPPAVSNRTTSDQTDGPAKRLPRAKDLPKGPPGDFWMKTLDKIKPTRTAVRARVRSLHEEGETEHVIALIQAALIKGQSQPWMYEILALSMELAGHPKNEVERVVLSMSDFGTANYDSMVQSARYLLSFERREAALTLLKQAADIDPDRAEAYLMAIPLISRTQSTEAAMWALPGAVSNLWGDGTNEARKEAESLARQLSRLLKRNGNDEAARELTDAVEAAGIPDIRITLEWDGECDLDLAISEPGGTRCNHQSPLTPVGGRLLADGFGPAEPVEEYVCAKGVTGSYLVKVDRAVGEAVGNRARLTISVRNADGSVTTTKRSLDTSKETPPIRIELKQGRRTEPQQVLQFAPPARRNRVPVARSDAPVRSGAVGLSTQVGVVSEGVQLNAVPVVSPDRRYVRLGLQPWFQSVTGIETFRLSGGNANGGNANGGNAAGQ